MDFSKVPNSFPWGKPQAEITMVIDGVKLNHRFFPLRAHCQYNLKNKRSHLTSVRAEAFAPAKVRKTHVDVSLKLTL